MYENFGNQATKPILARHKKSCSAGTMYCTQSPTFSTKSINDPNYQFSKKYNAPKPNVTVKCEFFAHEFAGFYGLRQHKNTQHGFRIKTTEIDPDDLINEVDDGNPKKEMRSCHYFLVDSELERARHKVFKNAICKLGHLFNN